MSIVDASTGKFYDPGDTAAGDTGHDAASCPPLVPHHPGDVKQIITHLGREGQHWHGVTVSQLLDITYDHLTRIRYLHIHYIHVFNKNAWLL